MEYLHILKIGENQTPSRVEVAVIGRDTIQGVECFFHSDGRNFIVSHLESGGQIAERPNRAEAIALADIRLSDHENWSKIQKSIQEFVLASGFIYPINPVPA